MKFPEEDMVFISNSDRFTTDGSDGHGTAADICNPEPETRNPEREFFGPRNTPKTRKESGRSPLVAATAE
jgi:hypothetical protein